MLHINVFHIVRIN